MSRPLRTKEKDLVNLRVAFTLPLCEVAVGGGEYRVCDCDIK